MARRLALGLCTVICAGLAVAVLRLSAENAALRDDLRVIAARLDRIQPLLASVHANSARLDELSRTAYLTELSRHAATVGAQELRDQAPAGAAPPAEAGLAADATGAERFASIVARLKDLGASAQTLDVKLERVLVAMRGRAAVVAGLPTLLPARGWISSEFGMRRSPVSGQPLLHKGFDIAAPEGSPVVAPADGVVRFAGKFGGFGNYLSIVHANGIVTKFGHNATVLVQAGDRVRRGQQVATVGSSGRSTGIHLHFEVWVNDQPVDPRRFLDDPALAPARELVGPDAALAPAALARAAERGRSVGTQAAFDLHDPALVAELYADAGPEVRRQALLTYLRAKAPRRPAAGAPPALAYAVALFLGGSLLALAAWRLWRELRHRRYTAGATSAEAAALAEAADLAAGSALAEGALSDSGPGRPVLAGVEPVSALERGNEDDGYAEAA